jgi:molybdopterin molybdotransferase
MISLYDAISVILGSISQHQVEVVSILDASGRVLAEPVYASWDMPLIDNSAMDGYAVRSADCNAGANLLIAGFAPAGGSEIFKVGEGEAVRIMTGAPIPSGADSVVPLEECILSDDTISFLNKVKFGQHIRLKGEDFTEGENLLSRGTVLRPAAINMLASFSKVFVPVFRLPRIAIVATGDELIELGSRPEPGQVINSNSLALASAVKELGAIPLICGIARDSRESHRSIFSAALESDMLITSAGVSAGDKDFVREILQELGVIQKFWKVAIKPGGPTAFGMFGKVPVFSLPGNPVSSMLTFELMVRPAILKIMGHNSLYKEPVKAFLTENMNRKYDKLNIQRVAIHNNNGKNFVKSSGDQKTGFLKTLVAANGYILVEPGEDSVKAGTEVDCYLI